MHKLVGIFFPPPLRGNKRCVSTFWTFCKDYFCFFILTTIHNNIFWKSLLLYFFFAAQQQQVQAQQNSPPQRGPTAGAATAATAFPSTSAAAAATPFPSTSTGRGTTSPSRARPRTRRRPRSRSRTQSRSCSPSRRAGSVVRSKPPAKMPKRGRRKWETFFLLTHKYNNINTSTKFLTHSFFFYFDQKSMTNWQSKNVHFCRSTFPSFFVQNVAFFFSWIVNIYSFDHGKIKCSLFFVTCVLTRIFVWREENQRCADTLRGLADLLCCSSKTLERTSRWKGNQRWWNLQKVVRKIKKNLCTWKEHSVLRK